MLAIKLPIQSLRVHSIGVIRRFWSKFALLLISFRVEKVFDIACALANVIPFVPFTPSQFAFNLTDYMIQLTLLLMKLPGGSNKFTPLLSTQVEELLPRAHESDM